MNFLNSFIFPFFGYKSTAQPVLCALVLEPPTVLFKSSHLKPELTNIALPHSSRNGSNILSAKYVRLETISSVGVLSIFNLSAVSD
jgi:hypothetical protein